ncbi:MAG: Uma2 family endonuclease [Anaerolineae bacterium]|nr:Uma2 family endonuclease [Anaerolineae bacterium]
MVAKENLHTFSEYMDFVQRPENADRRFELIDGEIKEMPPTLIRNSILASWFAVPFWDYIDSHIMAVSAPKAIYKITESNAFQPEMGLIAKARMGGWEGIEFPVAPELAVEVISPSEGPRDVVRKAQTYLQAGTKVVLAVFSDERLIDVYRLNTDGTVLINTLRDNAELTLDDVLPRFKVNLDKLFSVLDRLPTTK